MYLNLHFFNTVTKTYTKCAASSFQSSTCAYFFDQVVLEKYGAV